MKRLANPLDLHDVRELAILADIVGAIRSNAPDEPLLLIGAFARDVLLEKGLGIRISRATRDIDLAIAVEDWAHFDTLRQRLVDSGEFSPAPELQRLHFRGCKVDLLPFAGIERADRTIAWPPRHDIVMSTMGFREAMAHSIQVILPSDGRIQVPSPAALAALKLLSWRDRPALRQKDAGDLLLYIRHYASIVGLDELYEQVPDPILASTDGDNELMAAWLLGRHIGELLAAPTGHPAAASPAFRHPRDQLLVLLGRETDPQGQLSLAAEMDHANFEQNIALLGWVRKGLES